MNRQPNETQKKAIERIKRDLMYYHGGGRIGTTDKYEFKRFDVEVLELGTVSVVSEIGLIGDEGTAAQLFGRDYRHIFIGKRGGLRLANAKNQKKSHGIHALYALTF